MAHSFDICIDESGDQGFSFASGSSEWFVLSAVVIPVLNVPMMTKTILEVKSAIGWKLGKPLHFRDVKIDQREAAVSILTSKHQLFRSVVVMVHKPCLEDPERFRSPLLYQYFTRFLLERAYWLCRDSKEGRLKEMGDGTANVVFSQMNETSRQSMRTYMDHLQSLDTSICWDVIRPTQFETLRPSKHVGLQFADAVAAGFFCGDHHIEKHKTGRWCELWKPILYRGRNGNYRGYGLKLFPAEAEKRIAQGTMSPWAMSHYPK